MEKTHITEINHIIIREIILPGAVNESFILPATLFTLPVPLKFKDNDKIVAADAAKTFIQVLLFSVGNLITSLTLKNVGSLKSCHYLAH